MGAKTLDDWRAEKAALDAKYKCGVCDEVRRYPSGKPIATEKCPLCSIKYCYRCEFMDCGFCATCGDD